ncbi:MAG: SdrD B-like domain-containing protein, partial [Planctomycetota bacterium]
EPLLAFGNQYEGYGSIHGQKFEDLNGNGSQDAGELGLDGWTIVLRGTDDSHNEVSRSVTTMSMDLNGDGTIDAETERGMYWFTNLKPGTYTIREEARANWRAINPSSGEYTVTVTSGQVLTGLDFGNQIRPRGPVVIDLRATDLAGRSVSQARVGQTILLQAFAEGSRALAEGVFAAYLDVLYDAALATVSGPIVFGSSFGEGQSGDTATRGLLDEVGGFSGEFATSDNPALVFSVPFRVTALGRLTFFADPADERPQHHVLLFGQSGSVPIDAITYGAVTIDIVNPWRNPNNANDVDGDGIVAPLDVLQIINELSDRQFSDANGELPFPPNPDRLPPPYLDVNGDFFVSPLDALLPINEINRRGSGGEGEAPVTVPATLFPRVGGFSVDSSDIRPAKDRGASNNLAAAQSVRTAAVAADGFFGEHAAPPRVDASFHRPLESFDESSDWLDLDSLLDDFATDVALANASPLTRRE